MNGGFRAGRFGTKAMSTKIGGGPALGAHRVKSAAFDKPRFANRLCLIDWEFRE